MSEFNNKTAVISGGAEGIGLSIARALGAQGMNIVLGDIAGDTLAEAEIALRNEGINVVTESMDVTQAQDWLTLANTAEESFGKIHMLVNNAGVASKPGSIEETNLQDWRWVLDVNLIGVVQGTATVLPRIKQHQEGGWLINVASMAGMAGVPYAGAYTAAKVAVVGMSESWRAELAADNIHVAVLCPAFVQTRIHLSGRNRQAHYRQAKSADPNRSDAGPAADLVNNGIPVEIVGKRVVEALQADEFYIFTHPSYRDHISQRSADIEAAFDRAARSPLLKNLPTQGPISFR